MEFTLSEALEIVGDGHSVISVEAAQAVCDLFAIPFPEERVMAWESQHDALTHYGFVPNEDQPGQGVGSLDLSYYVAKGLDLGAPGRVFLGRGSQARANAQAIAACMELGKVV